MALKILTEELQKTFKHGSFKNDIGKRATEAVHERDRDVLICMPAGAEKSFCFLLQVVLQHKQVVLMICPSFAQIRNQIDTLRRLKINAKTLNAKITEPQKNSLTRDLQSQHPETKILYSTPEVAVSYAFKRLAEQLYSTGLLSYIIIDDAHCLSGLSHDFRSAYRQLGQCRQLYPKIPMVALTVATEEKVIKDIITTLKFENTEIFMSPAFRENVYYDVSLTDILPNPYLHLKNFIDKALGPSDRSIPMKNRNCGIIYCRNIEATLLIAEKLTKLGIKTLAYHAGLNMSARDSVQNQWTTGCVSVIAATSAFGMGIDKGSVRFVVHWTVPLSIGEYFWESGRAARDEKPAFCRIYVTHFELGLIRLSLNNASDEEWQLRLKQRNFEKMIQYCLEAKCRHATLSKYFGNVLPRCIGQCDSCKHKDEVQRMMKEFNNYARKLDAQNSAELFNVIMGTGTKPKVAGNRDELSGETPNVQQKYQGGTLIKSLIPSTSSADIELVKKHTPTPSAPNTLASHVTCVECKETTKKLQKRRSEAEENLVPADASLETRARQVIRSDDISDYEFRAVSKISPATRPQGKRVRKPHDQSTGFAQLDSKQKNPAEYDETDFVIVFEKTVNREDNSLPTQATEFTQLDNKQKNPAECDDTDIVIVFEKVVNREDNGLPTQATGDVPFSITPKLKWKISCVEGTNAITSVPKKHPHQETLVSTNVQNNKIKLDNSQAKKVVRNDLQDNADAKSTIFVDASGVGSHSSDVIEFSRSWKSPCDLTNNTLDNSKTSINEAKNCVDNEKSSITTKKKYAPPVAFMRDEINKTLWKFWEAHRFPDRFAYGKTAGEIQIHLFKAEIFDQQDIAEYIIEFMSRDEE